MYAMGKRHRPHMNKLSSEGVGGVVGPGVIYGLRGGTPRKIYLNPPWLGQSQKSHG